MRGIRWTMLFLAMAILFAGIGLAQTNGDFTPQNVDFIKTSRRYAKVKGELTNNSGKDLRHAEFFIRVYDEAGNLINSAPFTVRNFVNGTTRSFNTTIQANVKDISGYTVEPKLRGIGSVQTSRDFIPQNVDFIKTSRTYAQIKGELINNSGKNLRHADFVIQVYDEAGSLISSAPFSVRNFVNGTTRSFNTSIQANVKDISSYKVEFKAGEEIPPSP